MPPFLEQWAGRLFEHGLRSSSPWGGPVGCDVVWFANTDWYLYNFRLALAQEIRERGRSILMVSPGGEYGPRLRALGFRWEPIDMQRRSLRPDRELRLILSLTRILRRERPSLIHNFTIKCAIYGSFAATLSTTPSMINAITGLGYVFTSDKRLARLLSPAVRALMRVSLGGHGSRIVVQNPTDKRLFEDMRFDAGRVTLIPGSGVNVARFSPRGEARSDQRPLRVLFCGRVLWDKGVAEFVEAAGLFSGSDVEFVIAGLPDAGNPSSVPVRCIEKWAKSGLIAYLGHVEDMPALLRDTDIFVLPSYREGLSKSLIEAAACALPLIATDVPGCRDVIEHETDGLLVPARNGMALASAIRRLVEDRALAQRLGAAAREKALRDFDEQIVISRTLALYDSLGRDPRLAGFST